VSQPEGGKCLPSDPSKDLEDHGCRPDLLHPYNKLETSLNTVMPGASDLIFYPPPELRDATAEEIVDAALACRPIAL
jgi:hypothetical protein